MKGEHNMRRRIVAETGCTEWDFIQDICVCVAGKCSCLREARQRLSAKYLISGPYQYAGDLHPCFRINTPERLIATVYIIDEPDSTALDRAERMVAGLSVSNPQEMQEALEWYLADDQRRVDEGVLASVFNRPAAKALGSDSVRSGETDG